MRKTLAWGLAVCLAAGPAVADSAKVTATTANVRYGPGVDSRVVASVARGTVLQVLETSGGWHKVRSADGTVQGWIRSDLVTIVPGTTAPPAAAAARPEPAPVAPSVASAGLGIEHKDVACMLAEESTQLRACFSSPENVGRAQIHFRALPSSLWYAVDLSPDGACHSAWLPRPKKETKQIEYFVFVIDREFTQTARPDSAPGAAFTPRVVARKAECMNKMMSAPAMGGMAPSKIVVSAARQATGQLLDAAGAQSMTGAGGLPGFSPQGVVMASTGAPPSAMGAASAGTGGGGGGIPLWAIVGGVAAAGAGVAVAAGGGGGGSGSGSNASSGSGNAGTPSSSNPASATLTGSWSGRGASNSGLSLRFDGDAGGCTFRWDVDLTLTQNGNAVTGPGTISNRTVSCSVPGLDAVLGSQAQIPQSFSFDGALTPPAGISIPLGEFRLVGTYSPNTIQASVTTVFPGGIPGSYTLIVTKR